jgi:putative ABC transport system permease protein
MTATTAGDGVTLPRARLRFGDVLRLGGLGLRGRPLRALLSALGISLGIASVVAVLGISASSQAGLLAQIDALGTNLLVAAPGQTLFGDQAQMPTQAAAMVARIDGVQRVAQTGSVDGAVYRNDHIPAGQTNGIQIKAASLNLPATLGAVVADGRWLTGATSHFPATVLGATAAARLGVSSVSGSPQVYLAGQWFTVVGILDPVQLVPDADPLAFVGWPVARERLAFDGYPTSLYSRARDDAVDRVHSLLAATADPAHPEEISVSRPSDALVARAAAKATYTSLFLGLGAVALLVGGVGIANVMVIAVLERRWEIGLRRALGATRRHVAGQFLAESLLLSGLGGITGVVAGAVITLAYASNRGWTAVVPLTALAGAAGVTMLVGAIAGLYPALRAARLSPTEVLHSV